MRTVELKLDGSTWKLAPTPLVRMAKATAFLEGRTDDAEVISGLCEAIFWGLRRAKQEVTLEFVMDNIDALNQAEVIAAFLDVNGFAPRKEAAPAAGEVAAG